MAITMRRRAATAADRPIAVEPVRPLDCWVPVASVTVVVDSSVAVVGQCLQEHARESTTENNMSIRDNTMDFNLAIVYSNVHATCLENQRSHYGLVYDYSLIFLQTNSYIKSFTVYSYFSPRKDNNFAITKLSIKMNSYPVLKARVANIDFRSELISFCMRLCD